MVAKLDVGELFLGNGIVVNFNSLTYVSAKCIGLGSYSGCAYTDTVKRLVSGIFVAVQIKNQTAEAVWKNQFFFFLFFFFWFSLFILSEACMRL